MNSAGRWKTELLPAKPAVWDMLTSSGEDGDCRSPNLNCVFKGHLQSKVIVSG